MLERYFFMVRHIQGTKFRTVALSISANKDVFMKLFSVILMMIYSCTALGQTTFTYIASKKNTVEKNATVSHSLLWPLKKPLKLMGHIRLTAALG